MITVIKRDGRKVPFDRNKIINAVQRAFLATYGDVSEYAKRKAENIAQYVENEIPQSELSVEQIQDYVEHGLMALKDKSVAKNYILYRKERDNARKNTIDQVVDEIVGNKSEYWLTENSNKDAYLVTTQRDYIAGAVSTDICKRRIFPKDVIEAHEQGIIHIHDMDYTLQPIHNCFSGDAKFVTDTGIKTFAECGDGTKVNVLDMNGDWRVATVKFYGEQHLQTVTFESQGVQKTVHCTPNHRWILADGTVTTELKVGDKLTLLKQQNRHVSYEANAFCEGYVLGKGFDYNIGTNEGTAVVLSEKERKYINMFKDAGFVVSDTNSSDGYTFLENPIQAVKKTVLRDYNTYDDSTLMAIFVGLYTASADSAGTISTHVEALAQMIRDISAISGYHILEEVQQKTAENVTKFSFRFIKSQPAGDNWTVVNIEDNEEGLHPVWCVEEPVTHSFTLEGGIVTGNCDLVNLEDMLQNGTVISKTKIDKPHKFSTACNIATQIIAQVASSQLGGQSISLAHLSPFVEDSRNKFRLEYPGVSDEMIEHMVHNDIVAGVQTLQYQIITLMTTNGGF